MRKLDLTDQRFGHLVAVQCSGHNKFGQRIWECRCDCGTLCSKYSTAQLTGGKITHCGCMTQKGRPHTDLTRRKFGKLTALAPKGVDKNGSILWECICECGNTIPVPSRCLVHGETKSCGCHRKEFAKTHGMCYTPEYRAWQGMKRRCYNPRTESYADYGGRGITVCDRWRNDFKAFFADMGLRPSPEHSVDREKVNGNYEAGNCRWATWEEQANNRRNKRLEQFTDEEIRREYLRRKMPRV